MKGSKLLTCVAALGMVLTVGACDGGNTAKAALCQSLDDIFDCLEEGANYHLQIFFNDYESDTYSSSDEVNSALSEGRIEYSLNIGCMVDAYYTQDALLFIYDWDVDVADGFDDVELYVNNEEEGTLDYYATAYVDETQSEVSLQLLYTYTEEEDGLTTWQEGFWNLTDLVEDREMYLDVYNEGESEVSGAYTQYNMTEAVFKGLYEALFVDNYLGWIYFYPILNTTGWFNYYFQSDYTMLKTSYAGTQYEDILIKYAGTTAYWYDLDLWQIVLNDMGDWFIWNTTEGEGKQEHKVYLSRYAEAIANVTEVGETEITEELVQSGVDAVNAMIASHAND